MPTWNAPRTDAALFAEPDVRFHKAILTATDNDVMTAFGALIEAALGIFVDVATRHPGAPAPSVPLHGAVLEAIRRRDAEGAHRAMMALLDRTARNVERNVASVAGKAPQTPADIGFGSGIVALRIREETP